MTLFKLIFALSIGVTVASPFQTQACSTEGITPSFIGSEAYKKRIAAMSRPAYLEALKSAHSLTLAVPTIVPLEETVVGRTEFSWPDDVGYRFKVKETLYGPKEKKFDFRVDGKYWRAFAKKKAFFGPDLETIYAETGHRHSAFWNASRLQPSFSWTGSDCGSIHTFEEGATYLVLRDSNGNFVSSEKIIHDDDVWLAAVRRFVANREIKTLRVMTLEEYWKELFESEAYEPIYSYVFGCEKSERYFRVAAKTLNLKTGYASGSAYIAHDAYNAPIGYNDNNRRYCPYLGSRYIHRGGSADQIYNTDGSEIYLENIATQATISDPRRVSIEEFISWMPQEMKDKLIVTLMRQRMRRDHDEVWHRD